MAKLTAKQEQFCQEYVIDFNATRSAIASGYKKSNARVIAAQNLSKLNIQERIAELTKERSERTQITQDDVLKVLRDRLEANPNELVEFRRECCRYCWGEGNRYQRKQSEYDADLARWEKQKEKAETAESPEEIEPFEEMGGVGFNPTKDPNPDCQECFGEGVGRAFFKDTRKVNAQGLALYAGIKETKDGFEVKMHSQEKALELIGKHLGMFTEKEDTGVTVNINVAAQGTLDKVYGDDEENAS